MARALRTRLLVAAAAVTLLVVLVAASWPFAARATIFGIASTLGFHVNMTRLAVTLNHASAEGLVVHSKRGEPVLTADRVDVRYSVRDLLPGSRRLYGLVALDVERPHVTLIHRPDGTWNVPFPQTGAAPSKPGPPLNADIVVRDGIVDVLDNTRRYADARRMGLAGVQVTAHIHPHVSSGYDARAVFVAAGGRYPLWGRAVIDDARGYERQRWTANRMPVAPLVNYVIDAPTLHALGGELRALDILDAGLAREDGSIDRHLFAAAHLVGGRVMLAGIARPIEHAEGIFRATNQTLLTRLVHAELASVPVAMSGGAFSFQKPKLRLGVRVAGKIPVLLETAPAAARLPLQGSLAARLLVEGEAARPLTLIAFRGSSIQYAAFPLDDVAGSVALHQTDATILSASGVYAGVNANARGNVHLGRVAEPRMVVTADVPPDGVPYLARVAPGLPLRAVALVEGTRRLQGRGVVSGTSADATLAATFDVDASGSGRVGPLTLDSQNGRSLYVRAQLDKPNDSTDVVAVAHRQNLREATDAVLPGLRAPALPQISGVVDGALIGEVGSRGPAFAAGRVTGESLRVSGISIDRADVVAVGAQNAVGISHVAATGPWGDFAGSGSLAGTALAIDGRFRGDLAAVGALVGQRDLRGSADVPLRVLRDGGTVIAQVQGARFAGGAVRGISLEGLDTTVALQGSDVRVYSANAIAAGGRVVAAGSVGSSGSLTVSTTDLPLSALPAKVPVQGGRVTAVATVDGDIARPRVSGGAVLWGAAMRGIPVDASTRLSFADGRIQLADATALAAGAVANADGVISNVGSGIPQYALRTGVRGVDLARAKRIAGVRTGVPVDGSADADLAVSGSGSQPRVRGNLRVGAGSVNGLDFRDLAGSVVAAPGDVSVRDAGVTVGSTHVSAAGTFGRQTLAATVRAPHANLSDFNDFFDEADVLGGRGSFDVGLRQSNRGVDTRGRIAIQDARYRRFALGTTTANWSTIGPSMVARANVTGPAGTLALNGRALFPARDPLHAPLERVPLEVRAQARNVDLSTWLPAAGLYAPILGRVDADVDLHGPPRLATATTRLNVRDAFIGRIAVNRATVAAQAQRGRVTLTQAIFEVPSLTVTANGTFGLRRSDPVDLRARLVSPDVGAVARLAGRPMNIAGALTSDATVTGTALRPVLRDTLDVSNARYATLSIPRVHAVVGVDERFATLDEGIVDLNKGAIRAALHAPFDLRHPGLRANEPIAGSLSIAKVDLADFAPLLPQGTVLRGTLDGNIAIAGTTHVPLTTGSLALGGGYYASPQLRSPLTNVTARLALQDQTARLTDAHAEIGRGRIAAAASVAIGDLHAPARTMSFGGSATATNLQIDAPKYLRGTVNGTLKLSHAPGAPTQVAGDVSLPTARVPLSALYNPSASKAPASAPLPIAFDVGVHIGNDVRVQSGQVDVGGQGDVRLGGTLAAPTLSGRIVATSGTVDFYRSFRLQRGTARFDPQNGVMPFVYATATTRVPQPDTDVTLTVTGLAPSNLNVQLASDPSYDRAQILGLLLGAQQLGAVSGVGTPSGSAPNAAELAASFAGSSLAQQFTRQLLEPLSAGLGRGLGLSQFAINYDIMGGFEANARKGIGRHIDAVWAQTFSYPTRQSFGIEARPRPSTSVQLSFFQQQGTGKFDPQIYATSTNPGLTTSQPTSGTSGWTFVLQRRFWGGKVKPSPSPAPVNATASNPASP